MPDQTTPQNSGWKLFDDSKQPDAAFSIDDTNRDLGSAAAVTPYYDKQFRKFDGKNGRYVVTFNLAAFLFGVFWYFYRGLWLKALIMFALCIPLAPFFLLFWLYAGFVGNYDYYLLKRRNTQLWGS